MSKLRSVVVWLVLYTQVWTPVLAQTLPISVDKNVAGQRPVVGTANGVPVVNIAPPSAGGVSNNRFTQFNVGPSGVVLNNSGAASQTQLAGQVAGNPMLGNQRAATILNQVTANNPSRLMGMLEVAGNRANVIVANPAGITCNGCGFLNANRATLTTGKPVIGPDGTLGFDIASGRLAIEGVGLYGANLSQVDLLARTLELNAQVWADRLNVVAGSARVGYDGIDVSALAGDGAGTGVALDVAALGGMYANSIRLIDGGYTRITAGNLVNTGRIYGDRIGIQTPLLQNEPNAVIASRGDMDLGVGTLTNREHALIYAAGDLRIGGALDGTGKAAGQATLLSNESATIEVERNADIAAASIQNRNLHFASETVEVSREAKWFYRLDGTTDIVDGEGMWFCNTVKSICGRDPSWMGQYDERRLLMPSARYPESQYGPPFDYSNIQDDQQGRAGVSAPIGLAYIPETYDCGGGDAGNCYTNPAQFLYKPDAKIWSVFEVERPSGIRRPPSPDDCGWRCPADLAQQQAQYDHDLVLYDTLNEKIKAFNADFRGSRMIKDFTFYEVTQITRETRITESDPGKIIVGGNARLSGNIVNDKSRILAGGTLKTEGGTLSNVGAEGLRTVDRVGTMAYTYEKNDSRKYNRSDYNATVLAERIETGLGDAKGGAAVAPSSQTPGASTVVQALPPATLTRITLPGNQTIAVVVLPPAIPTSKLYQVITAPNAPYLIATDSQFIGSRTVVSSDFLLEKLNQDPGHRLDPR